MGQTKYIYSQRLGKLLLPVTHYVVGRVFNTGLAALSIQHSNCYRARLGMCTLADRCQHSLRTLTAPQQNTLLCPLSIPEARAAVTQAGSDSVVCRLCQHLSGIEFGPLRQHNYFP